MPKSKESLKKIYTKAVERLRASEPNMEEKMKYYRELDCKDWSNNDFFDVMARAVFTGIRDKTIEKRWPAITEVFSKFNVNKVVKYTEKDVQRLMKNQEVIKHEGRIRATISNARKMEDIAKQYGSFLNYVDSFQKSDDLVSDLQEQFDYIGEVNVYEFLTQIGKPFIKPDRQIRKVFLKLGLINEKATPEEIVQIGKDMAKAVNEKPAVVDWVLWTYGKLGA
ncbi:MAG: DNA-3-methyladenine glycosylase I [Candidatus Bathyarchaeia archaeon]